MEKTRLRNPKKDIMIQLKSLECWDSGSSDWQVSVAIYNKIEEEINWERIMDKERLDLVVKQWFVSGKPNQSIKLDGGFLINISCVRIKHDNVSDYRFTLISPNHQNTKWIDGETIDSYFDPVNIISEVLWDGFKTLYKQEDKYIMTLEQLKIKEGNIMQTYDKYTLPPSIDKSEF